MVAKVLKDVIEQAETWPQQDQEELAEYAREIQARRTGVYKPAESQGGERSWPVKLGAAYVAKSPYFAGGEC